VASKKRKTGRRIGHGSFTFDSGEKMMKTTVPWIFQNLNHLSAFSVGKTRKHRSTPQIDHHVPYQKKMAIEKDIPSVWNTSTSSSLGFQEPF
jgi:hypothetical protein